MKKASIADVKNNLSALIDAVKQGAPLLIMDRGRPANKGSSAVITLLDERRAGR